MRLHISQVSSNRRRLTIAAMLVVWGNPALVFADQASDVAALEAKCEAEREATTPIDVGDRFHVGAAILGAAALAFGAWDQMPSLSMSAATGLAVALGAVVLLSVVLLATWDGLRH